VTKFKTPLLIASLLLNGLVMLDWLLASGHRKIGTLTKDVPVGFFGERRDGAPSQFVLPKGLMVRDASPYGLSAFGQFEPYRFSVVITSESSDLVDYAHQSAIMNIWKEMYSARAR